MDLLAIAQHAVDALEPGRLVADALADFDAEPVIVLALGKAAEPMVAAAREGLGDRLIDEVVAGPGWGSHPIPGVGSMAAGQKLLETAEGAASRGAHVLVLISGGGSALAIVPAKQLTLAEIQATNDAMIRGGLAIDEINIIRKHISALKGGRLAVAAAPAPVTSWIISDVISTDLAMVASGPTLADPSTFADALRIAGSLLLPAAVRQHLEDGARGDHTETPDSVPGDACCLADNRALLRAVVPPPEVTLAVLPAPLVGDVAEVADTLLAEIDRLPPGSLLVAGGEPTLNVPAEAGAGGRAHHLALLLAVGLAGRDVDALVVGSDGVDGVSGGAGALVSGRTAAAISACGIDPRAALARFDSATALRSVTASLPERPTDNNLADLVLVSVL